MHVFHLDVVPAGLSTWLHFIDSLVAAADQNSNFKLLRPNTANGAGAATGSGNRTGYTAGL